MKIVEIMKQYQSGMMSFTEFTIAFVDAYVHTNDVELKAFYDAHHSTHNNDVPNFEAYDAWEKSVGLK